MRRAAVLLVLGGCLEVPGPSCPEHGDADGDGWECFGELGDCDDGDAARSPGAIEICEDGIDQDCDGADVACEGQLVGVTLDGPPGQAAAWQVTTETTQAQLDPDEAWEVSSLRLRADGEQLLYRGVSPERQLGVALYPLFHHADADDTTPRVVVEGPARVELEVTWEDATYGSGTSRFGFSPDGRIFRHEEFDAAGATSAANDIYFSTFASFDALRFTHLDWTTNPAAPLAVSALPNGAPFMGAPSELGWMCAAAAGRRVAMAWLTVADARGPRASYFAGPPPYLAFEYDWARDAGAIAPGAYASMSILHVDALADPTEPCADLDAGVFGTPAPLLFVTGSPGPGDLDNDGFIESDGLYEIDNAGGDDHVEVEIGQGALDAGVTFRVLIDAPAGIMVFRDGVRLYAGTDYLIQPLDGGADGVLVYLAPGVIQPEDVLRFALPDGEP